MENKSTRQLIEAANRKCEMRWKVLAFNPDEDNKLVKEFKDFDCIDCAVAKKREYLEKNPTHVVEIISESKAQRNEDKEFTIKLVTPFGKAKVCSWKAASVNDAVKEFLDANPAYRENKKGAVIAESAQRNEGNFKDDATSLKDAQIKLDRAKDELKEAIAQKDFNRQQRFKSDIKYYEDLIKHIKANPIKESSQKNEGKTLDDFSTREIANYIKTLKFSLPLNHPMSMNILGTKLKEKFGLSEKPHSIAIKALLDSMPKEYLESSQKNEALDEHELKAWLKSEHSRALKNIKNMAANDSSSFFKGYATALHEIQRKFGL